jgi:hypothetical protein
MTVKKSTRRAIAPKGPTLREVLDEITAAAKAARDDASRTLGVLANATAKLNDKKAVHKLRCLAGRARFVQVSSLRYYNGLQYLRTLLAKVS